MLKPSIDFSCPRHGTVAELKTVEDFKMCPNGGCKLLCEARLKCGHSCGTFCHDAIITSQNKDGHQNFPCNRKCERDHNCLHPCKNLCARCNPDTYQCYVNVTFTHPICGHTFEPHCYLTRLKPETINCTHECDKILGCGHKCKRACFRNCNELTEHQIKSNFFNSCEKKFDTELLCGHIGKRCCGQEIKFFQEQTVCEEKCGALLDCGHNCQKECKDCSSLKNILGESLHKKCGELCKEILICDHPCSDTCSDIAFCSPCQKKCSVRCLHSYCPQACGDECKKCIEPCKYICPHYKCTLKCGEICDRPPCEQKCNKLLACKHPCIGFCGEECPLICRICYPENQAFGTLFGTEDDPEAIFVKLDCGHSFESKGIDRWVKDAELSENMLKYISCPLCKKQIQFCMRYQKTIKLTTTNVNKVKAKILSQIDALKNRLVSEYKPLLTNIKIIHKNLKMFVLGWIKKIEKCKAVKTDTEILHCRLAIIVPYLQWMAEIELKPIASSNNGHVDEAQQRNFELIMKASDNFRTYCQKEIIVEKHYHIFQTAFGAFQLLWKLLRVKNNCESEYISQSLFGNELEKRQNFLSDYPIAILFIEEQHGFISRNDLNTIQDFVDEAVRWNLTKDQKLLEIQQVTKVLGLSSGHWYQCPNGHPYAIAGCGGAMQLSRCPDCGAQIGGEQHRLAQGNTNAGFIDGSLRPAFDTTNLEANEAVARELMGGNGLFM